MNKNNFPIYLSFATIFGILIGTFFSGDSRGILLQRGSANEMKIRRLLDYIERDYVDNVNTDVLLDEAITQMLGKLDPHSVYIPKENLQAIQENMQGNFVGIGIQFRMIQDSITVIQPIEGGPSIKAGIKAGDRIISANQDTLSGKKLSSNDVPKFLKGKDNTELTLQVYRKTNDSLFNINIKRGKVNIKSVDIAYMLNDHLGYVKLDRFARNTYKEFKKALTELKEQGMVDLVLDLRGNGGGFVDIATQIADEFLDEDKLIVFTKNNKKEIDKSYATSKGDFEKGGLYILIDENSASASEIVAGAMQDNDKGIIIGRRSFGKGLVQLEMDLGDGSAVRLTTARYYTPTGRSIQKPYAKNGHPNYYDDYQKRMLRGELLNEDSIPIIDSLKYTTPKGKVVYGGGGIIPDVFVAVDTTSNINNVHFISMTDFAFNFVDQHRKEMTNKWTLDHFIERFDQDDRVFQSYLSKIHVEADSHNHNATEALRTYLKASIANELFGDIGSYRIIHKKDKMLERVLELDSKVE